MPAFSSRPAGSALVTGASRGIGRVVALGLGAQGLPVAVNYRAARAEADETVDAIRRRGGRAIALQADVAVPEQAADLVRRAEAELGPLLVLVNNAGITRDRLLVQMTEDDWNATWQTDLLGSRIIGRAAVTSMAARRAGRVINVSSVVGTLGNAGQANYAAAKAALLGLTRQLAVQAAPHAITVNCVVPGYIETDATAHLTPEQREDWIRRIPMKRPATAEDVAELVLFLAVARGGYITGQCIAVDGGLTAEAGWGLAS
jgi:3-oxoacyl-[acyl-carrier protein] reductase